MSLAGAAPGLTSYVTLSGRASVLSGAGLLAGVLITLSLLGVAGVVAAISTSGPYAGGGTAFTGLLMNGQLFGGFLSEVRPRCPGASTACQTHVKIKFIMIAHLLPP